MAIYLKELRQGMKSWIIWTAAISLMLLICVLIYPQMQGEMEDMSELFANMGSFTAAFGMDKLSFGTLMGYYGIECANVLGIGGGFFAALIATASLAKEEKEHTAEFLLTHPVSRFSVVTQKLLAILTEIILLNVVIIIVSLLSIAVIDSKIEYGSFFLLHLGYFILQIEIAAICFAVSSFIKRGSLGIGLGLTLILYFINIMCNISEQLEFLKYFTPYAYSEPSEIISTSSIPTDLLIIGLVVTVISIVIAYYKYQVKDIAS